MAKIPDYVEIFKVTPEEILKVKKNSPATLPLNATQQGYTGSAVRAKFWKSICGDKDSIVTLLETKLSSIGNVLNEFYLRLPGSESEFEILATKKVLVVDINGVESYMDLDVLESEVNPLLSRAYVDFHLADKANKIIVSETVTLDLVDVYNELQSLTRTYVGTIEPVEAREGDIFFKEEGDI